MTRRRRELAKLVGRHGWTVEEHVDGGGHIVLTKPGFRPTRVPKTPGSKRDRQHILWQLRQAERMDA